MCTCACACAGSSDCEDASAPYCSRNGFFLSQSCVWLSEAKFVQTKSFRARSKGVDHGLDMLGGADEVEEEETCCSATSEITMTVQVHGRHPQVVEQTVLCTRTKLETSPGICSMLFGDRGRECSTEQDVESKEYCTEEDLNRGHTNFTCYLDPDNPRKVEFSGSEGGGRALARILWSVVAALATVGRFYIPTVQTINPHRGYVLGCLVLAIVVIGGIAFQISSWTAIVDMAAEQRTPYLWVNSWFVDASPRVKKTFNACAAGFNSDSIGRPLPEALGQDGPGGGGEALNRTCAYLFSPRPPFRSPFDYT